MLQWGRAGGRGKSRGHGRELRVLAVASMGPRRGARKIAEDIDEYLQFKTASMGPRRGARKIAGRFFITPFPAMCFNGAAPGGAENRIGGR